MTCTISDTPIKREGIACLEITDGPDQLKGKFYITDSPVREFYVEFPLVGDRYCIAVYKVNGRIRFKRNDLGHRDDFIEKWTLEFKEYSNF